MTPLYIAAIVFVLLSFSALFTMNFHGKLPLYSRNDETDAMVRRVANIFVVMTSLVFGLMINSANTTYANIDHNIHAYATNLIVMDRTLKNFGSPGDDSRHHLLKYLEEAIKNPARADDILNQKSDMAGQFLEDLGQSIAAIKPSNIHQNSLLSDIRQQYHRIIEQRWSIVEQSEGAIPLPMIGMLLAWLLLIFASFGYRAPSNSVTIGMFLISALLIAASVYLVLDMNTPFSGTIQISDMPYRRALAEINASLPR